MTQVRVDPPIYGHVSDEGLPIAVRVAEIRYKICKMAIRANVRNPSDKRYHHQLIRRALDWRCNLHAARAEMEKRGLK